MAENKKSFLLYCDLIHIVKKMPDEKAGQLLKIILSYVNDENPVIEDLTIDLVFESIKQQLKRDLRKYENIVNRNKGNGSKGGRPIKKPKKPSGLFGNPEKPRETQDNPEEPKKADIDIDTDNVIDNISICALFNWINEKCPKVQKMSKPITEEEALRIESEFYFDPTEKTFLAMENRKTLLKDYDSANLTFRSWIAKVENAKRLTREEIADFNRKAMGL